ncbi:hypothetical protein ANCCAN_21646 [Ancylostoma caninum]|uniref:Uncharacterized protein n=1 Tax=Ancylostoma caninum TaxID=29170 RepID=A0A368FNY0_ANCCA|nr:hypothetical protein ANCCAN_21646 [Ancylostoma caninum]
MIALELRAFWISSRLTEPPCEVDLPVKKLEELSRARMKCARHLRKMDFKKEEYISLWKLCNIYSATAVDVDDAMREIRNAIRKRLKPKETSRDVSAFRRLIDEYRPSRKNDHQQEIYDKPTSKDKQRWRELTMFGRKKEKEQAFNDDYAAINRKGKETQPADTKKKSNTLSIAVPAVDAQTDATANGTLNPLTRPQRISSPPRPPPPSIRPPDVFDAQIPAKAEKISLISPRQGEPPSSEPRQNCPPIPDRPPSVLREMTPPIYERFDGPQCNIMAPPDAPPPPPVPRQISPGTLYKPTAPPRPSAPRAKVITVDTSENMSNGEVLQPLDDSCAVFQLSHTTIAILPSPKVQPTRMQIGDYNAEEAETSSLERRSGGVLAKRHSIKIDTNTVMEPDSPRLATGDACS